MESPKDNSHAEATVNYAETWILAALRNEHFFTFEEAAKAVRHKADDLDKAQMLRLATCKYIDDGRHIILRGASGNGKTYIACALGNAACRKFKSVRYIRMPELLDELSVSKACGEFKKAVKKYQQVDLLILDCEHCSCSQCFC